MNKLFMAISVSLLGHILAWFHMEAQFKWTWASNTWWIAIGGIPISYAFFYGTKWYYEFFGKGSSFFKEKQIKVCILPAIDNA